MNIYSNKPLFNIPRSDTMRPSEIIQNPAATAWIRTFVLVALAVQNASHALLGRYSKGIRKETYDTTEVVLVAEIIKAVVSGVICYYDTSPSDSHGIGLSKLYWLLMNSSKTLALVFIYGFANMLTYYSLEHIDAATFSVLLQLKTLSTATFTVILLGRNITGAQWRALVLLIIGCTLVASPVFNTCENAVDKNAISIADYIQGVGAALGICVLSGYAVTYFEQILKKPGEMLTIWERNFQLATYSAMMMLFWGPLNLSTRSEITQMEDIRFFQGWSWITVLLSIVAALGGLLVAACLKYADGILKTLATSVSIIVSTFVGT